MGLPLLGNKLGILRRNEGRDAAMSRVMSFAAGANSKKRVSEKIGTSFTNIEHRTRQVKEAKETVLRVYVKEGSSTANSIVYRLEQLGGECVWVA